MKIEDLKKGDILFFKIPDFFKKFTKKKYYHSEVCIDSGEYNKSIDVKSLNINIRTIDTLENIDVYRPRYKNVNTRDWAIKYLLIEFSKVCGNSIKHLFLFWFTLILRQFKIRWFEEKKFLTDIEVTVDYLIVAEIKKLCDIPNSLMNYDNITKYFDLELVK